jgi:hypothetical protein
MNKNNDVDANDCYSLSGEGEERLSQRISPKSPIGKFR